jgi:regulatory protein
VVVSVKPALSLKARALAMLARREHSRAELRRKLLPHARAAALAAAAESAARALGAEGAPLSDLHRSPGPASAGPGLFSAGAPRGQVRAAPGRGGRRGAARAGGEGDAEDFDVPDGAADAPETPSLADIAATLDTGAAWAQAESAVEELLDWLQAHRYLSEQRFAESRVHARAGRFGNLRIRQELAQHGVELDAEATQRLRDSELERCRAVWARKFGELPADAAARARQMRFLAGRGFSADVIRRVLQAGDD